MSSSVIYVDENVRKRIVRELKRMGYNVRWFIELGLRSISNRELLEMVEREGATLITHDSDYTRISIGSNTRVIYIHPSNSDEQILSALPKLIEMTRDCRLVVMLGDGRIECYIPTQR